MPEADALYKGPEQPSPLLAGKVAVAPATVNDPLTVKVPSLGSDFGFTPIEWMPRALTPPQVGDNVLLAFDESNNPWVVAMAGALNYFEPGTFTFANWTNGANRVTALDRNSWTNQQLFDLVATLVYDWNQS